VAVRQRLGLVLSLAALACVCGLAAQTDRASAAVSPAPYLDGTFAEEEAALLDNLVEYLVPAYTEGGGVMSPGTALPVEWEYILADVAAAGETELLPASVAFGPVGLAVAGTLLVGGTLIYMHWFKDDAEASGFSCTAYALDDPGACHLDGQRWTRKASAAVGGDQAWEWEAHQQAGPWTSIAYDPATCNTFLASPGYPCNIDAPYGRDFTREMDGALSSLTAGATFALPAQNDVGGYTTADGIPADIRYRPCASGEACEVAGGGLMPGFHLDYLGTTPEPGTYTDDQTFTMPDPTVPPEDAVGPLGDLLPLNPPEVGNHLNCALDPTNWACPDPIDGDPPGGPIDPPDPGEFVPFALPQIALTETYGAYVTRLRSHGWLGTVRLHNESGLEVTAEEASAYATAPVGAPTVVTVPDTFPVPVYYTDGTPNTWTPTETEPDPTPEPGNDPWPAPAPVVPNEDTPIDIWKKPPDTIYPVIPPPGGGPPPGDGIGDCGDSSAGGGLDFSPLTCLHPGCKFPFGFVCYAQDVTGWFTVTADAPEFNFAIPIPALAGGGTVAYDVDLNVMDGWAATWRLILSVCMWVGAVYVIATRMLGLHGAGDPGEAMDDAWVGE
jgi:hypothetical protein